MTRKPVLECIPNFSEGRNTATIHAIAEAIRSVSDVALLHIDTSYAANRTVMTFAGHPQAVAEAAFRAAEVAIAKIDMRTQEGVHPRVGAVDVCPFVPLFDMTMDEAVQYACMFAERVARALHIPVYLYEYAARQAYRRALPDIRKGQYEGLAKKMQLSEWKPDFGPDTPSPTAGAMITGARDILVAFNIGLHTSDVTIAQNIAVQLRESGGKIQGKGSYRKVNGLLPKLRAIGWHMADYNQAQVSCNLLDYKVTAPLQVWQTCAALAQEEQVPLNGSEVIGLIPEICVIEAGARQLREEGKCRLATKELLLEKGITYLQLDRLKPFIPQEKILEYTLESAGLLHYTT